MAKVLIEESTLTNIGDAIREKEGTTELVPVNDMADRISAIETGSDPIIESLEITSNGTYTATDCDGYSPITVNVPQDGAPPEEAFTLTGNLSYRFANNGWKWFIDLYGNKITTTDINNISYLFYMSDAITSVPLVINVKDITQLANAFNGCVQLCECPKIRGTNTGTVNVDFSSLLQNCNRLRDLNDLFEPEFFDFVATAKVVSTYSSIRLPSFRNCHSLRSLPGWFSKFKLCPDSTAFPYALYSVYSYLISGAYALDEALNIPVWKCQAPATSNIFGDTVKSASRLKNFTFETNPDGSAIAANWQSQVIDFTDAVGWYSYAANFYTYNSGITADKQVADDATYQALKNDPDWFATKVEYSRYNHDSAVNTINSLPDTSAYLASAGGTNTIKFKGAAGSATDGGAINTLTEEEIAVAAAKGWTVTLV